MNTGKKVLVIFLMVFIGGIVMQSMGYIDCPFFAWFTNIEYFEV